MIDEIQTFFCLKEMLLIKIRLLQIIRDFPVENSLSRLNRSQAVLPKIPVRSGQNPKPQAPILLTSGRSDPMRHPHRPWYIHTHDLMPLRSFCHWRISYIHSLRSHLHLPSDPPHRSPATHTIPEMRVPAVLCSSSHRNSAPVPPRLPGMSGNLFLTFQLRQLKFGLCVIIPGSQDVFS